MADSWQLEASADEWLLEDGSGTWLMEVQTQELDLYYMTLLAGSEESN